MRLIYKNISKFIFSNHKIIFSFQITLKLLEFDKKLNEAELNYLLGSISSQSI